MPPTRRLVRRRPLKERIIAMLNPMDFLLWVSEEIETREWDSKGTGTRVGLFMSLAFLLARANTGGDGSDVDDVFGDDSATGWVPYIVCIITAPRSSIPTPLLCDVPFFLFPQPFSSLCGLTYHSARIKIYSMANAVCALNLGPPYRLDTCGGFSSQRLLHDHEGSSL